MTHSVQTSAMNLGSNNNSVNYRTHYIKNAMKFYQVDIEDFDNEVYSYEVEARNDEEAAEKAEQLFSGDIYTMYVYLM
ncbi:MAG: hypothetical protein J6B07_03370 [Opitutales bacterium]|nr:hypothetical protein [Opitutales bacterium]